MEMWKETPGMIGEVPEKVITGVTAEIPQITYYGAKDKTSDIAIVIFPGGGYGGRADHEGRGYAEFFNENGIDAFVCDYRVYPHHFPLPLLDARRAVRWVRYHADEYGINKDKILVIGSSAGGSLATLVSTYREPIEFEGVDEIDNESPFPNGQILCYPVVTLENDDITHVDGSIDPGRDIETINLELIFSDIEMVERRRDKTAKLMKGDKSLQSEVDFLDRLLAHLGDGKPARSIERTDDESANCASECSLPIESVIP